MKRWHLLIMAVWLLTLAGFAQTNDPEHTHGLANGRWWKNSSTTARDAYLHGYYDRAAKILTIDPTLPQACLDACAKVQIDDHESIKINLLPGELFREVDKFYEESSERPNSNIVCAHVCSPKSQGGNSSGA